MIDGKTLPHMTPIYTFVDNAGDNVHIHPGRLRTWCLTAEPQPEVFLVPIEAILAARFIAHNAVSLDRCRELAGRLIAGEKFDPIIFAQTGGTTNGRADVLLVDGHHRYMVAVATGAPFIEAFVLTQAQWRPFEIVGLPSLTQDQLRDSPIQPRSY